MATSQFHIYDPSALSYDSATNSFTFDPGYDFRTDRVLVEVTDDDAFLDGDEKRDEIGEDANQTGRVTRPDGVEVAAGRIYGEAFGIIEAPDGTRIRIDRIEIGGQNVGYAPSRPLEPGVTYRYVGGRDIDNLLGGRHGDDTRTSYARYEAQSVACFVSGTIIDTPRGGCPVQWLRPGDAVVTRDFGALPIRWAGAMPGKGHEAIVFRPGTLDGQGPRRLRLSAQHRIAVPDPRCEMFFGLDEVLVAACHFAGHPGVARVPMGRTDRFHHLLLDRHALIRADGSWTESLFLGDRAQGMDIPADLSAALAPGHRRTVLPCLRRGEARLLLRSRAAMPPAHRLSRRAA